MQLEEVFETIVEHWTDILARRERAPSDLFDVLPVTLADPVVLAWLDRGILHSMAFDRLEIEDPHPPYGTQMGRVGVDPAAAERAPGPPVVISGALEVSRSAALHRIRRRGARSTSAGSGRGECGRAIRLRPLGRTGRPPRRDVRAAAAFGTVTGRRLDRDR